MPNYNDIFIRDFVEDTGQVPSTSSLSVSSSQDIIPSGTVPLPNYQSALAANDYQNVQKNLFNYICVRGYNLYARSETFEDCAVGGGLRAIGCGHIGEATRELSFQQFS